MTKRENSKHSNSFDNIVLLIVLHISAFMSPQVKYKKKVHNRLLNVVTETSILAETIIL